ncbi:hypothetical protein V502_04427 [Pseudogymnoascus sp. VKM F-4520 (FW-2644)]|nr:hypothetical protein V502_04427 [Pseudogymnoascus sp. VKM F-4520 (FW-2644)]
MVDRITRPVTGNTVLLFGSLALSFDAPTFHQLRNTVTEGENYSWILDTVAELPQCLKTVTQEFPDFQAGPGIQLLEDMSRWFETGHIPDTAFPLPNILLNPLVIITHLTQYSKYLEVANRNSCKGDDIFASSATDRETLGFCTGLLSAAAVSSSASKEQFQKYGAVALRIGMLVGLVVDTEDASAELGESVSFSVVWNSAEAHEEIKHMLKSFPDAYISVHFDENRATITAACRTAILLKHQLGAAGISTTDVGLHGRYHSERHRSSVEKLMAFCDSQSKFQFPQASELAMPTRSNSGGDFITQGTLHHEVLQSILVQPPRWHQTFSAVYASTLAANDSLVVSFGPERSVPPSLVRRLSQQMVHMADLDWAAIITDPEPGRDNPRLYSDNDIAVIGMSCKVPGANNLEEFWELLCKGESQHREVPNDRFGFETIFRSVDAKRKWFGNFIDDYDVFDHKFFKKSPREIASTDPQQRHILQIAYQAVEQSGYFLSTNPEKRVGCYVGVCACDYEDNIACHAPSAFSATGNLRGFIAGKISHYFGWTGPGLTIDSACSSSAVAVHQACKAILNGECNAALAGGTHVMTSPLWFQNLAGASFLSLTGQCKPFDAEADGYCRGEGVAAIFLKRMSAAIADGDQILGAIAATAVQQNQNCTPIFVPNAASLSDLFTVVTSQARLKPGQITVVEAHGTGTAVGDPVEYDSIRRIMGGSVRSEPLMLSSVKGLVGHQECTSGIVSIIKILLMLRKGAVPPQASFTTINPAIKASPKDLITIPTRLQPWDADFRAALINNYGASGSNASLILTQAPFSNSKAKPDSSTAMHLATGGKYPFWFCGLDDDSLRRYSAAFRQFLGKKSHLAGDISISNLSFNMSRQNNRLLGRSLMFTCRSINELESKLALYDKEDSTVVSTDLPPTKPVVLCFGGQVSTFVGLDRQLYESVSVLRNHLNHCDNVCRAIGAGSIFPGIFERNPIQDAVKLQTMLFAIQYSCAKCWMDSSAKPVAVVGHSFGELTALCISGCTSLRDTLKMIVTRARIIQDSWGSEKGAMMAVEANLNDVQQLLAQSSKACPDEVPASIACYNGPRSFTLAGSNRAIEAVVETVASNAMFSSIRSKKLNVTNAFHSTLVEPLMASLKEGAQDVTFQVPKILLERATEVSSSGDKLTSVFLAEHMRHPVYFNHAVQRLAKQYPSCIFLEAGSNSTITSMASRALGPSSSSHFQSVNITSENAWNNLVDTTLNLWKAGLSVSFWAHQASQIHEYPVLFLPPYQFSKTRHWMELKPPPTLVAEAPARKVEPEAEVIPKSLLTFVGYQDNQTRCARFRINTMIPKYKTLVAGHVITQTAPICPATVQVDLAIEALRGLRPDLAATSLEPQVRGVENQSPLCVDPSKSVWLDVEELSTSDCTWSFHIFSTGSQNGSVTHTTAKIIFRSINDLQVKLEFARYERLVSHQRCLDLLRSTDADDIIQGRNIYKTFSEVVDYGEEYRGLHKLVGKGDESAGYVVKKYNSETWLDAHLSDTFCQVGGIWVNCMTDRAPQDIYIANGIEQWIRSPKLRQHDARPETWNVFAYHSRSSDKVFLTDIFVFNAIDGVLMEVILGISYVKVAKASMSKLLSRLTASNGEAYVAAALSKQAEPQIVETSTLVLQQTRSANISTNLKPIKKKNRSVSPNLPTQIRTILAELSGLEPDEIKDDSELADIGIDSLMGMEMAHEIEKVLKCAIPDDQLMLVTNFPSLVQCVRSVLDNAKDGSGIETEESEDDDQPSDNPSIFTPSVSDTKVSSVAEADVVAYLIEFLGIERGDLTPTTILRDLGVDSLLSTELRSDLASKFDVEIEEHLVIEELTVEQLELKVNGPSRTTQKTAVAPNIVKEAKEIVPMVPITPPLKVITSPTAGGDLKLPSSIVLEAFGETKQRTDRMIADYNCADYVKTVMPEQTRMCIALTVEAFEQLGCPLSTASPGQKLSHIKYLSEHSRLVNYLIQMLEKEAQLINVDGDQITRTGISAPSESSQEILQDLLTRFPDHSTANKLTHYAGSNLAAVLTGTTDGIKVIFGSPQGKELVSGLYGDWPLNRLFYKQMEDFLTRLVTKLPMNDSPLRILEMGAGTGGTTKWLVPLLASLQVPVEYTFTDLAPSFVAAARKKFKPYPFMKFRTHDIEKAPADDLLNTQHIIIASNAVHATHSLSKSVGNILKALRPDGFLMMLEMTGTLYWVDIIFGLFEGWWMFDDGRTHAVTHESRWERELHGAGYGHVDWTDGSRPENGVERLIIAMASSTRYNRTSVPPKPVKSHSTDYAERQAVVDEYVQRMTNSFTAPVQNILVSSPKGKWVLVTGATGSLGSHLVAHFASLPDVQGIICLNRRSNRDPMQRQIESLRSKGIHLSPEGLAKLQVFESDLAKPMLGLPGEDYENLLQQVTHIVHNAWLMNAKQPLKTFIGQFQIMRNMLDLTREISCCRLEGTKVSFQFVSSIATVGHYPLWTGDKNVPEERMAIESVLPNGYGDAKYICELMLDQTLHQYPNSFRTMAVRIGQIAGSKLSGYWNPMEHLSFLWKSSQTLKAIPDFDGLLSWTPVDDVAGTLADLILADNVAYPIYHIDNPQRQQWRDMIPVLADALDIPISNAIPFHEWVQRVRDFPKLVEQNNPAALLIDFLDDNFIRMSCGGLLLDTSKSREHSRTLATVGPVTPDVAKKFVQSWKDMRFLS